MLIRPYREPDGASCAAIYERAWNSAFPAAHRSISRKQFEAETEGETILVAEENDDVLGFASVWMPGSFLHHLYVDPLVHRRGIGTALLRHVAGLAPSRIDLKCQTLNTGALSFYAQQGFVDGGEHGEDEYGVWIRLTRHQ